MKNRHQNIAAVNPVKPGTSMPLVIVAFLIVYIVWGSTYFFIARALNGFPPFFLGAFRFIVAGLLMLSWCRLRGMKIFDSRAILDSGVSGILMLGIGTGIVFWVEQYLASALVAIMVSSVPIWFAVLDKKLWKQNLGNIYALTGLIIGFLGVLLLFWEKLSYLGPGNHHQIIIGMILLLIGPMAWAKGSIYSRYHPPKNISHPVSSGWQMLIAGSCLFFAGILNGEHDKINFFQVPGPAWWSMAYLIVFGSIIAYSAYLWLLKVRPATQVSTYAYVNPVVAVLLSLLFSNEPVSWVQLTGLVIILLSVLLLNLSRYRNG